MDFDAYLRFALALALVLGLIGLAAYLARRFGLGTRTGPSGPKRGRRLAVLEVLPLDPKRRLVLIAQDESEHLLLLGPSHDLVIAGPGGNAPQPDFRAALAEAARGTAPKDASDPRP